ncbi:heavy-metal-associated domain-containing protein [Thalassobacillus devorans]|uniref:heavy-metal-associated domain-containing protein n=1 Tax=Thalassobacillus devorans TaxID=279813 RepID=UPI000A1C7D55|nr:heavy-metal-associated domain-containing protein [Thalassobacillus devorans]
MKTIHLKLEPLTCPSCIKKIEGTIAKMAGVTYVKVLFHSSKVKIQFEENLVNPDQLEATVTALGFTVNAAKMM